MFVHGIRSMIAGTLACLALAGCGAPDQADLHLSTPPASIDAVAPAITIEAEGNDAGEYYLWVSDIIGDQADAIQELTRLVETADQDNEQWYRDVAVQLMAIERAHTELTEMPAVPASMATQHRAILGASWMCHDAIDPIERGIDKADAGELDQGIALLNRCVQETREVFSHEAPSPTP